MEPEKSDSSRKPNGDKYLTQKSELIAKSEIRNRHILSRNSTNSVQTKHFEVSHKRSTHRVSPKKRCFSPEALELAVDRQIILTRNSSAGIAMLAPKRARFGDWGSSNHHLHHYHQVRANTHIRLHSTSRSGPTADGRSHLRSLANYSSNRHLINKEPTIPMFSLGNVFMTEEQRLKLPVTFYSSGKFPWDEWARSNFTVPNFREILLSGKHLVPVSILETEGHVFIKLLPVRELGSGTIVVAQRQTNIVRDILKAPFSLPFKFISSIFQWIVGN